ncbi:MAG: hypothetical protein HZB26_08210 [Candidatus Hydrogenedentes bacterium]|nr:hypothetical protein [Candidatus Hydrogenedentota bacterium]
MKKGKKAKPVKLAADEDDLLPEYDFSRAVRGVTAKRYAEGTNLILLSPDVAKVFPTGEAANEALRSLIALAKRTARPKRRAATRS